MNFYCILLPVIFSPVFHIRFAQPLRSAIKQISQYAITARVFSFCCHALSLSMSDLTWSNADHYGRAISQAASCQLPTMSAQVRAQVKSCGVCGGQSGTGAGFLRVRRFPVQFSFRRLFHIHHYHLSSGVGTMGQLVDDVPSVLSLNPPQETRRNRSLAFFKYRLRQSRWRF
jgi:hypothetical protein